MTFGLDAYGLSAARLRRTLTLNCSRIIRFFRFHALYGIRPSRTPPQWN